MAYFGTFMANLGLIMERNFMDRNSEPVSQCKHSIEFLVYGLYMGAKAFSVQKSAVQPILHSIHCSLNLKAKAFLENEGWFSTYWVYRGFRVQFSKYVTKSRFSPYPDDDDGQDSLPLIQKGSSLALR